MQEQQQFHTWINSIIRQTSEPNDYIQWKRDEWDGNQYVGWVKIYTRTYSYSITCRGQSNQPGYLGCVASARKPYAGEEHTRGTDLADGYFSKATWRRIVLDILQYEMVKIVHSERRRT
jgi:hypothetical protein